MTPDRKALEAAGRAFRREQQDREARWHALITAAAIGAVLVFGAVLAITGCGVGP